MIDPQRQIQWRANVRVSIVALVLLALLLIVLPLIGPMLYDSHILRFPLGYLLTSIGSVIGLVALIYWVAIRQDRLDARYNISGDY